MHTMYPKEIANIERNRSEIYRVSLNEFKGKLLCDIRIWYLDADDNYQPGKKGVSVPVEKLDELIAALQSAKNESSNS